MKKTSTILLVVLAVFVGFDVITSCKKADNNEIVNPTDSLNVGLIAYYPFNDSGVDYTGNGNDGFVYNITSTSDRNGKPNSAYYFDGSTSYVRVPDSTPLRLSNTDYTINTWEKLDSYGPTYGSIIVCKRGVGNTNGWNYGIHGYIGSDNSVLGQTTMILSGGLDITATGVKKLSTGTWYMLTTVYSIQKHQITYYVNGVLDNVISNMPTPNPVTAVDMYIGADNPAVTSSGYFFKGSMDDMRIYGRALPVAQIQKLYTSTF